MALFRSPATSAPGPVSLTSKDVSYLGCMVFLQAHRACGQSLPRRHVCLLSGYPVLIGFTEGCSKRTVGNGMAWRGRNCSSGRRAGSANTTLSRKLRYSLVSLSRSRSGSRGFEPRVSVPVRDKSELRTRSRRSLQTSFAVRLRCTAPSLSRTVEPYGWPNQRSKT